MSGIAGIFNIDGAPVDPDLLRRMAEAAAHRGPDGINYWIDGNVGFAHLALKTTPESLCEQQPMSNRAGTCWITADARVDNRDELLRALSARDVHLEDPTDAELILAAYELWGIECPEHILGDFAFAIWDRRNQCLVCVRDHMGAKPFYYHYDGRTFFWASEVKQILRIPTIQPALNEGMLGSHLAADPGLPGETFYEGIAQLLSAHWLMVTPNGLKQQRYWDIDPGHQIRYKTDEEYAQHFLTLFRQAVRCRLRSHRPIGVMLSGGLDSSSIACMAAHILREESDRFETQLETFSWIFDELRECDERKYSQAVVDKYGLCAHRIIGDNLWPLKDSPQVCPERDEPFCGHYQYLICSTLALARLRGMGVILSGHWGDNLVHGSLLCLYDYLRSLRLATLVKELVTIHRVAGIALPLLVKHYCLAPAIPDSLRLPLSYLRGRPDNCIPKWLDHSFVARVNLTGRLQDTLFTKQFSSPALQQCYEWLLTAFAGRLTVWLDRIASPHSMEMRHPFLDIRLIEFALAIPSEQLVRGGQAKVLLRNAMRGILPESIRQRNTKAYPSPLLDRALRDRERTKITALLESSILSAMGYVSSKHLCEHYERYCAGIVEEHPLWYTLVAEIWLRDFFT